MCECAHILVRENLQDYNQHIALIAYCREHNQLIAARTARERLADTFPLHECTAIERISYPSLLAVWLEWIEDEEKLNTGDEDAEKMSKLLEVEALLNLSASM